MVRFDVTFSNYLVVDVLVNFARNIIFSKSRAQKLGIRFRFEIFSWLKSVFLSVSEVEMVKNAFKRRLGEHPVHCNSRNCQCFPSLPQGHYFVVVC